MADIPLAHFYKALPADTGKRPPVHDWHPELSGDIDIRIAADGVWYHEGSPINRRQLVTVFASILRREGDEYFLVSPVEKWRITVDEVPFFVSRLEVNGQREAQSLTFTTDTGERVTAGKSHPIRVAIDSHSGEPSPYLLIRDNMEGKIARSVFYELAELAASDPDSNGEHYSVFSQGQRFRLA